MQSANMKKQSKHRKLITNNKMQCKMKMEHREIRKAG